MPWWTWRPPAGDEGWPAPAFRWGEVEVHEDGSGRLHVMRSKTDQAAEGSVLYLGPAVVETLLAIRPQEAVIDPGANVFGLSFGKISRRTKAAAKIAGLGGGFSAALAQGRDGPGPERRRGGAAGTDDRGSWDSPTVPTRCTRAQAAGRGAVAQYYRGRLRDKDAQ